MSVVTRDQCRAPALAATAAGLPSEPNSAHLIAPAMCQPSKLNPARLPTRCCWGWLCPVWGVRERRPGSIACRYRLPARLPAPPTHSAAMRAMACMLRAVRTPLTNAAANNIFSLARRLEGRRDLAPAVAFLDLLLIADPARRPTARDALLRLDFFFTAPFACARSA